MWRSASAASKPKGSSLLLAATYSQETCQSRTALSKLRRSETAAPVSAGRVGRARRAECWCQRRSCNSSRVKRGLFHGKVFIRISSTSRVNASRRSWASAIVGGGQSGKFDDHQALGSLYHFAVTFRDKCAAFVHYSHCHGFRVACNLRALRPVRWQTPLVRKRDPARRIERTPSTASRFSACCTH